MDDRRVRRDLVNGVCRIPGQRHSHLQQWPQSLLPTPVLLAAVTAASLTGGQLVAIAFIFGEKHGWTGFLLPAVVPLVNARAVPISITKADDRERRFMAGRAIERSRLVAGNLSFTGTPRRDFRARRKGRFVAVKNRPPHCGG
jgi:hypothetical protein